MPDASIESATSGRAGQPRPSGAAAGAALLCVLSMSSVQFGAALSTPTMAAYGSLSTTWLRLGWAALLLAAVVRPRLSAYSRAHWFAAAPLGVAMAGMTLCFFAAVQRIPLGLAVAIEFLGPLTVATLAVRRARALLWPALAIVGVVLLSRDRTRWVGEPLGVMLACAAACGWACYILLMKKAGKLFAGLEGLSVSLIAAALVATPVGLAQTGAHIAAGQLMATAGLAILVPLLPYALQMIALRHLPAGSFGILMSAEPAIGAVAGLVVLNQPLGVLQIAGTLMVVAASVGAIVAVH
jgi:inner membrane transporter RhtA